MSACKLIDDFSSSTSSTILSTKTISDSITQTLCIKQQLLFDGFFRMCILPSVSAKYIIPLDIHQECAKFFCIDIECVLRDPSMAQSYSADPLWALYKVSMDCYKQSGEYWIAYEILSSLSTFYPDSYRYHNGIGLVLDKWNVFDKAKLAYVQALELKPESHIFRWNYALLMKKHHEYECSAKLFLEASTLDNQEPEYFFNAAACLSKLNRFQEAKQNYLKTIELEDKKPRYLIEYGKFMCTQSEFEIGNEYFQRACSLEPENWELAYEIARYLRDVHREYAKAEMYYKQCLNINPMGYVAASYGYVLYLMRRYDDAEHFLRLSLDAEDCKSVNPAWRYVYYGLYLYNFAKFEQAYYYIAKSVECFNDGSCIDDVISHLNVIKQQDPKNTAFTLKCEQMLRAAIISSQQD